MTPEATAIAATSVHTEDKVSAGATLQTIEQRTRAIAEVAEALRPLLAFAQQTPAFVAILMDSFDEAMPRRRSEDHARRRRLRRRRSASDGVRKVLAAAIVPGVLIGAALGLLGGGGSVLTVPIFVYVLGFIPKEAIAMSLAVVGATSAFGTASHWRAGNVNVRMAVVFGAVAMVGTVFGVRLARFVPGTTQLVIFGAVLLAAAVFMLRGHAPFDEENGRFSAQPVTSVLKVVPGCLLVGALTGLVGVGAAS